MVKPDNNGFSLIELIIFVVVLGISFSIVTSFNSILRFTHYVDEGAQGLELAQQRMELIVRNPSIRIPPPKGNLNNLVDVCANNLAVCNTSAVPGYVINTTISSDCSGDPAYNSSVFVPATDCREVTVVVTKTNGTTAAILTRAVTRYSW